MARWPVLQDAPPSHIHPNHPLHGAMGGATHPDLNVGRSYLKMRTERWAYNPTIPLPHDPSPGLLLASNLPLSSLCNPLASVRFLTKYKSFDYGSQFLITQTKRIQEWYHIITDPTIVRTKKKCKKSARLQLRLQILFAVFKPSRKSRTRMRSYLNDLSRCNYLGYHKRLPVVYIILYPLYLNAAGINQEVVQAYV